ncbi:unnamed protein product [Ectocarpus sp. 8 AP-2014]
MVGGNARPDELFEEEFVKEVSRMAEARKASGRGTGGGNARKKAAAADPSPPNSEPRSDTEGDARAADGPQ